MTELESLHANPWQVFVGSPTSKPTNGSVIDTTNPLCQDMIAAFLMNNLTDPAHIHNGCTGGGDDLRYFPGAAGVTTLADGSGVRFPGDVDNLGNPGSYYVLPDQVREQITGTAATLLVGIISDAVTRYTLSHVSANGATAVYTFAITQGPPLIKGNYIETHGFTNPDYNISGVMITAVTPTTFTVDSTATGSESPPVDQAAGSRVGLVSAFGDYFNALYDMGDGATADQYPFTDQKIYGTAFQSHRFSVTMPDTFLNGNTVNNTNLALLGVPYCDLAVVCDFGLPNKWEMFRNGSESVMSGTPDAASDKPANLVFSGLARFGLSDITSNRSFLGTISYIYIWARPLGAGAGPILTLHCSDLPNGTVGIPYAGSISATGGTPPYTYALISGPLPDGMTLNSDGTLSGTPTEAGTFPFSAQVTDSASNTATVTCTTLIINASVLVASCGDSTPYAVGSFYSRFLTATGGVPPYTWALIGGSLPPGLSLNSSTGQISGFPTDIGVFTFTVEVTDDTTATADVICSIGIHNPMRLTYADQSLFFDYTDTQGNGVTLRYEVSKKRWFPHFYADHIAAHYLAEADAGKPNSMDILMPSHTTNLIYKAGGNEDDGHVITALALPGYQDGGDERSQKLYVDHMVDMEGTGTLQIADFFDNGYSNSPVVTYTGSGPRVQKLTGLGSLSNLALYRNIAPKFAWTGGPDGLKIYAWEPSGFLQPYLSVFFVTQFIPYSFPGWKHMRRAFPAIISTASILMSIKTQDGRLYGPYTIPSTAGQYRILPFMLDQNIKDLAFAVQLDGQGTPFAIFFDDFTIEVKEWTEETYIKLAILKA